MCKLILATRQNRKAKILNLCYRNFPRLEAENDQTIPIGSRRYRSTVIKRDSCQKPGISFFLHGLFRADKCYIFSENQ